jgi:hypothetical protein
MSTGRSVREIVNDHLELARSGEIDDDLRRNYAPDVTCFTSDGIHRGHDALRRLAQRLFDEPPGAVFEYTTVLVDGDVGFLEWTATSEAVQVRDGADSFLVRDGRIVAQTIHYTVEPRPMHQPDGVSTTVAPQGRHDPEAGA